MNDMMPAPPRWAELLLISLLKPADAESISGDLLEEYRAVRRPALGSFRADAWYIKHVLSVLWRILWPCAIAIAALHLVTFPLPAWNPSLVPAPGVSLLDAAIFLWASFYGARHTGRVVTGVICAIVTSVLGFKITVAYAAVTTPGLLLAPFEQPFVMVILSLLFALALGFGVAVGTAGAVVGRWLSPAAPRPS